MKRVSVIDVGTNSAILLALESDGETHRVLYEHSLEPRLGKGLGDDGLLSKEAIKRTIKACQELVRMSGLDLKPIGTGTHAMRIARNSDIFLDLWRDAFQSPFRIVTQKEEARLAYKGAGTGLDISGYTVIDVGGGSTEIISDGSYIGLPFGAVNLTEKFELTNPLQAEKLEKAVMYIKDKIEQPIKGLVLGVGGTASTIASIGSREFEPALVHGKHIDKLPDLAERLRELTTDVIRGLIPFAPKRADIINAGILIYETLLASEAEFVVSQRGLRWGYALELLASPSE